MKDYNDFKIKSVEAKKKILKHLTAKEETLL